MPSAAALTELLRLPAMSIPLLPCFLVENLAISSPLVGHIHFFIFCENAFCFVIGFLLTFSPLTIPPYSCFLFRATGYFNTLCCSFLELLFDLTPSLACGAFLTKNIFCPGKI